jgi:hypothetical protein
MTPEMRARIIAYNKKSAERKVKAADMDDLLEKLRPIIAIIEHFLPDEVKAILKKYDRK